MACCNSGKQDPPHVAEQTGVVVGSVITDEPLASVVGAARGEVMTRAMGAFVSFEGVVRDHDGGAMVESLTYSAHPDAARFMEGVLEEVAAQYPVRLWAVHRVGPLEIGDEAFVVLAASAHRADAFEAASLAADRVKAEVPIWKEQILANGETDWVGLNG